MKDKNKNDAKKKVSNYISSFIFIIGPQIHDFILDMGTFRIIKNMGLN